MKIKNYFTSEKFTPICFFIIFFSGISAENLTAQSGGGGCVNCLQEKDPSAMNGNGSLGVSFSKSKCGLNYVQASVPLQRRNYQNIPSSVQPATVTISGIPSCATVEKAVLYAGTSGDGVAITATIKNPANNTTNFPMTIIGSDISKCWDSFGYHQTFSYRADVSTCITGNGTYTISGLPVAPPNPTDTNDTDGATLFIVYVNPNAQYKGDIVIYDGAYVIGNFGTATTTMTGLSVCANSSSANAFAIVADIQPQNGGVNVSLNGSPNIHVNGQMWDFVQQNTTVSSSQTTATYKVQTSGDCFNFEMAGLYFQTTTCTTCGNASTISVTSNQNNASCTCNGTATVNPSGGNPPYTYNWSNNATTSTISGLCAGTYIATIDDASGCNSTSATVTITSAASFTLSANSTSTPCSSAVATASAIISGGNSPFTFLWNNGQTTSTATNLSAGNYSVTVTDGNGCSQTTVATVTCVPTSSSSCPAFANPSFENGGISGGGIGILGAPWNICAYTPDTYPAATPQFTTTLTPSNGQNFIGFYFTAPAPESFGQQLSTPLTAANTYSFTIDAAAYSGGTVVPQGQFEIWGGNSSCANSQLLWTSPVINNLTWQTFSANLAAPTSNYSYLTFDITCSTCIFPFQNAYIFLDNIQCVAVPSPSVTATGNSACAGNCVTLTANASSGNSPYTYLWSGNLGTTSAVSACPSVTTIYTVTITDANSSTATTTATATIITCSTSATCPAFQNPSFENGGNGGIAMTAPQWTICNLTPDLYPPGMVTTSLTPTQGQNFAGFTSDPINTGESFGQQLTTPLNAGGNYSFSMDLAGFNGAPFYFPKAQVEIWGGNSSCAKTQLLWTSPVINNLSWQNYTATLAVPTGNYSYITFQSICPTCVAPNEAGYMFLDNIQCTPPVPSSSCPAFVNPDFEGQPPTISAAAPSWTICGSGTPDICPQPILNATVAASSGSTYQGGSNSTPEMWGQQLSSPITAGTPYSFTMDMYAVNSLIITGNGQLEIWGGGNTSCAQTEKLWTSPVLPSGGNWQTVPVNFTPLGNHTYILFKPVMVNGLNYVCVDNIQCSASPPSTPTVTTTGASACAENCVTLTANVSSGTPPYTYLWSGGLGTTSAVTACPSSTTTYTVTITDANSSTATATATATINSNPTANISGSGTICSGSSATLTANGGGNYSWNTNATTASISISPTSTTSYTVTVTNGNGCTATATATATISPQINITTSSTNSSCGTNTGSATANASGGSGTFTYSWNTTPIQNTSTATGLSAGNYSVIVTDAQGCSSTQTVSVANSNGGTASLSASQNVSCFGGNNGSATVSMSGGSSPFTYLWNNGQTTSTANNLSAGNYSVVVTDANGCSSSVSVNITQPSALSATTSSTANISCLSPNGTASVAAAGGSGSYTYLWNPSAAATATATGLQAGNYSVTITDANGCTATQTVSVAGPTLPTISVSGNTLLCQGDQTTLTATGGVVYSWSNGSTNNPLTVSPASSSTYSVVGADANGCTNTSTISVTVSPPPTANITGNNTICSGNNTILTASGGGNYLWNTNETTSSINISSAGNYSVVVSIGTCTATANFSVAVILSPTANAGVNVVINIGESTTLNATGGGTYSWSPSAGLSCANCANPVASPTATTDYCVFVTNSNGCSDSNCVRVTVEYNCTPIYIPNAFSPNGDNENDEFFVYGNCIKEMKLIIYNRWGEKVFQTTEQKNGWNGEWRGKTEDSAVFSYYFEYTLVSGEKGNRKGNVSLIK
ncbi:MAG: gliding motility-associated C-terminal domain-containing protein [Bacteroidetes bacterium]|nr:gliding motility-associated C-terminal domain-containing protein [Bacteroidota bacterium]